MRPRRLEVTAFGPYPETEFVDFDELGAHGMFVVSGPTGSGKTSVFDAMCWALYGRLPGYKTGSTVASHHAAPEVACRVVFEFTAQDRAWQVERRPKQDLLLTSGKSTTQLHSADLRERTEQGWEPRLDGVRAVTERCEELTGLTRHQFEQVMLLPQGRFQQVLQATSKERADLLRTLFATQRFLDLQDAMHQRAKEAESLTTGLGEDLQRRLAEIDRFTDAAERALHGEHPGDPCTSPVLDAHEVAAADPEDSALQSRQVRLSLLHEGPAAELGDRAARAAEAHSEHLATLERARLDTARIEERRRLDTEADRLTEQRAARDDAAVALERHQAASRMLPHRRAYAGALSRWIDAGSDVARAHEEVTELLDDAMPPLVATAVGTATPPVSPRSGSVGPDPTDEPAPPAAQRITEIHRGLAELDTDLDRHRSRLDRATQLTEVVSRIEKNSVRLREARQRADVLAERRAECARSLEAIQDSRLPLAQRAIGLDSNRSELEGVIRTLDLRHELTASEQRHAQLATELDALHLRADEVEADAAKVTAERAALLTRSAGLEALELQRVQAQNVLHLHSEFTRLSAAAHTSMRICSEARSEHERLFGAFLTASAPRLADELVEGSPCPVCGSAEHPSPADGDTEVSLDQVTEALDTASLAAADLDKLTGQIDTLTNQLGDDAQRSREEIAARLTSIDETLDAARQAQHSLTGLDARLVDLTTTARSLADARAQLEQAIAQQKTGIDRLAGQLGDDPATVKALDERRKMLIGSVEAAEAAVSEIDKIDQQVAATQAELGEIDSNHRTLTNNAASAEAVIAADYEQAVELDEGAEPDPTSTVAERPACEHAASAVSADALSRDEDLAEFARRARTRLDLCTGRVARSRAMATALGRFATAIANAEERRLDARSAETTHLEELERSIFESVDELDGALLSDHAAAASEGLVVGWDQQWARVQGALDNFDERPLPETAPDLEQLQQLARASDATRLELQRLLAAAESNLEQAERGLSSIETSHSVLAESLERARHLRQVADTVKGDNARKTTLESWVLAGHLEEVVRLANVHLETMSRGRYKLAVADEVSKGGGRSGLDLEIEDAVTGRSRDPRTLSGGETFQASLSLALGVADLVSSSAGEVDVGALFIDEGFGSLDPDALDQAIDVLDQLRSRGQLVGVITHIEAVKAALPVGIEVRRRSDGLGSTLRQHTPSTGPFGQRIA